MYTWIKKLFSCCYIIEDYENIYGIEDSKSKKYEYKLYWYQYDIDDSLDYVIYD